jgi:hypothetical protein
VFGQLQAKYPDQYPDGQLRTLHQHVAVWRAGVVLTFDEHWFYLAMKATAVRPGQKNSVHLADLPVPSLDEIPNGRGVLVRLLCCGVDGTDKEINAAEYGAAPEGTTLSRSGTKTSVGSSTSAQM